MTRRTFLGTAVLSAAGCVTGGLKAGAQYGGWARGHFQIHFIYTGAGESLFLIFPDGTTMLLDCGDFEAGARGDLAPKRFHILFRRAQTDRMSITCLSRISTATMSAPANGTGISCGTAIETIT